jgi:hypothetical protein
MRAGVVPQQAGIDTAFGSRPAAEISRLRRENDRLRMERDILTVAIFSSSRNPRNEVSSDRGSPGGLAGARHVRGAERPRTEATSLSVAQSARAIVGFRLQDP